MLTTGRKSEALHGFVQVAIVKLLRPVPPAPPPGTWASRKLVWAQLAVLVGAGVWHLVGTPQFSNLHNVRPKFFVGLVKESDTCSGAVLSAPSLVVATRLPPHPVQHQEESPPPPAHQFQVTSYSRRRKPPAQQTSTYCIAAAGWDEQPWRRAKPA